MAGPTREPKAKPRKLRTVRPKAISPIFISKSELAIHLGCSGQAIEAWIELGRLPPPHSRPGERHTIWLREHFDQYVKTRRWPKEAYHTV